MKRHLLVFFLVSLVTVGYSQTQQDQADILQICFEIPELQPFLMGANGSPLAQLYVKSCNSIQDYGLTVNKFGNPVRFVDKVELSALSDKSHIDFFIFEVMADKARVDFTFSSDSSEPKFWAYLELEKNGTTWEITQLKSEER